MTVRYRYKSILKDGGVEVFDRRGDTGDLNSRLNIISTVLNNTGASSMVSSTLNVSKKYRIKKLL